MWRRYVAIGSSTPASLATAPDIGPQAITHAPAEIVPRVVSEVQPVEPGHAAAGDDRHVLEQPERELALVEQAVVRAETTRDDRGSEEREPRADLVAVQQLDAVDPDRALMLDHGALLLRALCGRGERQQAPITTSSALAGISASRFRGL